VAKACVRLALLGASRAAVSQGSHVLRPTPPLQPRQESQQAGRPLQRNAAPPRPGRFAHPPSKTTSPEQLLKTPTETAHQALVSTGSPEAGACDATDMVAEVQPENEPEESPTTPRRSSRSTSTMLETPSLQDSPKAESASSEVPHPESLNIICSPQPHINVARLVMFGVYHAVSAATAVEHSSEMLLDTIVSAPGDAPAVDVVPSVPLTPTTAPTENETHKRHVAKVVVVAMYRAIASEQAVKLQCATPAVHDGEAHSTSSVIDDNLRTQLCALDPSLVPAEQAPRIVSALPVERQVVKALVRATYCTVASLLSSSNSSEPADVEMASVEGAVPES